ncbi:MAG: ABC transporter permease [Chloroflexota bacterium]|nr:ABC transporter permease [Chloroflexota bacterium]
MSFVHEVVGAEPAVVSPGADVHPGPSEAAARPADTKRERGVAVVRYFRRNPSLIVGTVMIVGLLLFSAIGTLLWEADRYRPLSVRALQPPSWDLPFGSDKQGRDLFAVMIAGTPMTLRIGLIAGFLGVGIGTVLAFVAAYYGGWIDTVIRGIVDVGLTVPGLLVLIIVAITVRQALSVEIMALVVASLAWLWPARTIRAQVLTMRERSWVQVAKLSGMSGPEIIVKEMLPNLFPYLAAALVNSISSAILASIGLEALGLGPIDAPTLGMTVYWVLFNAALINGWWWWWAPPIVILFILFVGLFLVSVGLDEIANPRLRKAV